VNNYEYIIASLPVIRQGMTENIDCKKVIDEVKNLLEEKDRETLDFLLGGWKGENLTKEFYTKALAHKNKFIRSWFEYDLGIRNAKAEYLNKALARAEGTDVIVLEGHEEFEDREKANAVFSSGDILERERGIDNLLWQKLDRMMEFEVLTLKVILGFCAKLQIMDRWFQLDPETGREMLRKLVNELKNTGNI